LVLVHVAWTGHLVHVAIPESRGIHVGWDNFLTTLPHPEGLNHSLVEIGAHMQKIQILVIIFSMKVQVQQF